MCLRHTGVQNAALSNTALEARLAMPVSPGVRARKQSLLAVSGKWIKSPAPHTRKAFACISYSPSPSASGGFNHSLRAGSCPQATSPPGACFACIAHYAAFAFRLRRKPWVRGASAPPRGKSTSAEPSNHAARAWRSSCLSCVFWAL